MATGPYTGNVTTIGPKSDFWSGEDHYVSAAVDGLGNLYMMENETSDAGGQPESGYLPHIAWTTGGQGNYTWHTTTAPGVSGADYRYAYSFMLPDLNGDGGVDFVATRDVECTNTAFDGQYGYTSHSGYMFDSVYDWHTVNINASGGPSWTLTQIKQDTSDNNCSGITENIFANDAYRDSYGTVHVLYADNINSTEHQALLCRGASCTGGSWQVAKDVDVPTGYCSSAMRITQDYTGRFYLLAGCGAGTASYVWACDTTDGTSAPCTSGHSPTTTLSSGFNNGFSSWFYLAVPRGGTALTKYVDIWYPYNSNASVDRVRIGLASGP